MKFYLQKIDTSTQGNRCDVTPLFACPEAFNALVDDLLSQLQNTRVDIVAGIDALGFILGTAIAQKLNVGILPVRKGGKLPVPVDRVEFKDYTGHTKQLEIRQDILTPGQRVLVVDEWIETGAQVSAAISLIVGQGAVIAGIATINIDENERTQPIRDHYRVFSV